MSKTRAVELRRLYPELQAEILFGEAFSHVEIIINVPG